MDIGSAHGTIAHTLQDLAATEVLMRKYGITVLEFRRMLGTLGEPGHNIWHGLLDGFNGIGEPETLTPAIQKILRDFK